MSKLILLRHGQSKWNEKNLFTGFVDVPLSEKGILEAKNAGSIIKDIPIDLIFTSGLSRAIMTMFLAMDECSNNKIPILSKDNDPLEDKKKFYNQDSDSNVIKAISNDLLNERHYGQLQGMDKAVAAEQYGAEQIKIWRRSYDVPPPGGESLEMTATRTIPYFKNRIEPHLTKDKNILIVAHGNSLRSIIFDIEGLSKEEVINLEIPTGSPVIYNVSFDNEKISYSKESA